MLEVKHIHKQFDGETVLSDVALTVEQGEIVCLLGSSGSGKTTLLRIISGLETPDTGTVTMRGKSIGEIPVHRRGVGLMFQDFALFPHMTVGENIRFGMKMQRLPEKEQRERVHTLLEITGLTGFGTRAVGELSGGEKQRVALARSLAPEPKLLLLDEPLGSLDAALRERLIGELRDILKQVGTTAVYVTHDQREAFAIADRIAVVIDGNIARTAPPEALYHFPETERVAQFLGFQNLLPIQWLEATGLKLNRERNMTQRPDVHKILLHPAGLSLDENGALRGEIERTTFLGDSHRLTVLQAGEFRLTFEVRAHPGVQYDVGSEVRINAEDWAIQELSG